MSSIQIQRLSQLLPQPIAWLWPGRLARGKLAILDGDPGLGKSLLTLDLAARLSTGQPFPDGGPSPGPGNVLILNAEDGDADTLRPRLQALGADLERVFLLPREVGAVTALRLPTHLAHLDEALTQTHAVLVVVDPIVAFLEPGVQTANDQSVRRALYPLAQLCERHQCVLQMVRHLNKSGGSQSLYRGGGSIGFVGACRSGWLVARDPEQPERRVLAQVKNNLAAPQPSLAFEVVAPEGRPPHIVWSGPCSWTADQLLAGSSARSPALFPRDCAREFLADLLQDGPQTSRTIWELAQKHGFSRRTLDRARDELKARSVRVMEEGKLVSYWLLEDQQLPAPAPPAEAVPDLEEWLAPLRRQFPPSTPLDDL